MFSGLPALPVRSVRVIRARALSNTLEADRSTKPLTIFRFDTFAMTSTLLQQCSLESSSEAAA